ncbi:MAG: hypothetical protein ACT4P1_03170 [Sporichthyaceae bacterium]
MTENPCRAPGNTTGPEGAEEQVDPDDTTPFTAEDLVEAVSAVARGSHLSAWGAAVLTALHRLIDERPGS